jgi:plasmid rolling circle replication initiator protein Rep
MWQAKVYRALPKLLRDYPDTRFLFMTLTVRNCDIHDLRATLTHMSQSWQRLVQLRCFPARGWVRAVEITRSQRYRTAHPHYHCLLMVPPAYFQGDYLKQEQWAELWRQCLRVCLESLGRITQLSYHQANGGEVHERRRLARAVLKVLG